MIKLALWAGIYNWLGNGSNACLFSEGCQKLIFCILHYNKFEKLGFPPSHTSPPPLPHNYATWIEVVSPDLRPGVLSCGPKLIRNSKLQNLERGHLGKILTFLQLWQRYHTQTINILSGPCLLILSLLVSKKKKKKKKEKKAKTNKQTPQNLGLNFPSST